MQNQHLEPGMLRVFRLFAWLLLASKAILPLHFLRDRVGFISSDGPPPSPAPFTLPLTPPNLTWPLFFIGLYLALLFALLYWPRLQRWLAVCRRESNFSDTKSPTELKRLLILA